MQIPSFYDDATPPIEGYEDVQIRTLLNPSKAVWADYQAGGTDYTAEERQLIVLNGEILGLKQTTAKERKEAQARLAEIDTALAARKQALGRAFVAL